MISALDNSLNVHYVFKGMNTSGVLIEGLLQHTQQSIESVDRKLL